MKTRRLILKNQNYKKDIYHIKKFYENGVIFQAGRMNEGMGQRYSPPSKHGTIFVHAAHS